MTNTAVAGHTNLILDRHYWPCAAFHSVLETVRVRSKGCCPVSCRQNPTPPPHPHPGLSVTWQIWAARLRTNWASHRSVLGMVISPVGDSACLNPELTNTLQQRLITSTTYVTQPPPFYSCHWPMFGPPPGWHLPGSVLLPPVIPLAFIFS